MQHSSVLESQSEQYQLPKTAQPKSLHGSGALWIEPALSIELYAERFGNLVSLEPGSDQDVERIVSSTIINKPLLTIND